MEIELGNKVECLISGFVGIVYSIEDHQYGCTRVDIMPEGKESAEEAYNTSVTNIVKVDDGIVKRLNFKPNVLPRFKNRDQVETCNGVKGHISVITKHISGQVDYMIHTKSEDGETLSDALLIPESLLALADKQST